MAIRKSLMLGIGAAAFRTSAIFNHTGPVARAVLRHNFIFPNELKSHSIDRLRRQLNWLRNNYKPLSVPAFVKGLVGGDLPDNSIVFTHDDIQSDIMEVAKEFRSFGVPLAMYVPVGWVISTVTSEYEALIDAVTLIQWYEGPDIKIEFGKAFSLYLSSAGKASNIDRILENQDLFWNHLEELSAKISTLDGSHKRRRADRTAISWSDLQELTSLGIHMAPHSISHVRLAEASAIRQRFEINESKRVIEKYFGASPSFAYPYGTKDVVNSATRTQLKDAGFQVAFLTHSDVITASSPFFDLPRITLPDTPMPLSEFKARVRGGGILLGKLRRG